MQWRLILDGVVVGHLQERDIDQPFFICDFDPTPEFARFAPLFAEELRLLEADLMDDWEAFYDRIDQLKPRLSWDGDIINRPLIHIRENKAWFRY